MTNFPDTPLPSPKLGELLKARIARDEAAKLAQLAREASEAAANEAARLAEVQGFFDAARQSIVRAIQHSLPLPAITIGAGQNTNLHGILGVYRWSENGVTGSIREPSHPYFPVWESFSNWAASEGLSVRWIYDYDGGGQSSWFVLQVMPLAAEGWAGRLSSAGKKS